MHSNRPTNEDTLQHKHRTHHPRSVITQSTERGIRERGRSTFRSGMTGGRGNSSRRRGKGKNYAVQVGSRREPDVAAVELPRGKRRKKFDGSAMRSKDTRTMSSVKVGWEPCFGS